MIYSPGITKVRKNMERPNILLIVLDAARVDRFSCYGYHRKTTPNIDRLASEGTVFLNHYSTANQTLPSHVSMFTGIHPFFHGAATNSSSYNGRYPTIQEILNKHGYLTVGVSYNPALSTLKGIKGFQKYHEIWKKKKARGYLSTLVRQTRKYLKKQDWLVPVRKIFDMLFRPLKMRRTYQKFKKRLKRYEKGKGGDIIISLIKEEIKNCKQKNSNFYIFANILEPHWPYLPPKEYMNLLLQNEMLPRDEVISHNVVLHLLRKNYLKKHDIDWTIINSLYDANLMHADALLGSLFSFMEEEGIMDNTAIIITSDHGELLGEHGLVLHGISTYEPLIKVPLIIRYPEKFKRGYFENRLTQSIDLFPTILSLINAEVCKSFNYKGINLYFDEFKGINHRFIVIDDVWSRVHAPPGLRRNEGQNKVERAIITEEFKYVWGSSGKHRLHNLKEDPLEEKNLYSEAYRPIIEDLHEKMVSWYQDQLGSQQEFDLYRYDYTKLDIDALPPGAKQDELQRIEKMMKELGYMGD